MRKLKIGDDVQSKVGRLFRYVSGPDQLTIGDEQFDDSPSDVGTLVNIPLVADGRLENACFRRIA